MAGRDEKRSNDPELTSEDAISRARSLIDRSPDFDAPSRLPRLAAQFRKLVHRTLAHHDKQSRTQLNAVVDALENVERRQAAVEVTMRGLASDIALQNERIGEVAASATTARRELIELGKAIPQPDPDPDG
jgi:septal ring factor EnvC (AmiA/AmiB activator)